jgi:hypothetical protein
MSAATLLVILVVGLVAGWLAGQVVKGTGFGLVADIARHCRCFDRQLVTPPLRHSPRLGDRSGHYCVLPLAPSFCS